MSHSFSADLQRAYQHFLTFLSRRKASEHDLRGRFIEHVIRGGLGYDERNVLNEIDRTDIWLLDSPLNSKRDSPVPTVVIETKDFHSVNNARLADGVNIAQAFKYIHPGATRYVGLTNFKRFIVWSVETTIGPQSLEHAIADVDLQAQSEYKTFGGTNLDRLAIISYDQIRHIYDNFESSMGIDLTDPQNFEAFTTVVKSRILDSGLIPQFARMAENLAKQHLQYLAEETRVAQQKVFFQKQRESAVSLANLESEIRALTSTYRPAIDYAENFSKWENEVYASAEVVNSEDRRSRFANETAYTLLSRMLLIRIAEDKGVLSPNLSNGELARRVRTVKALNRAFKMVLQFAFADAEHSIYKGFFQKDVFDWYWDGDGELNDSVKKALWYLNQYNFSGIQRDVFKYIYQHHMDKDERKKIGEYYTPDEVVRYILNSVGFESNRDLRQLRLLDPGCGSGTFLVEAVSRLKKQGFGLTPEEIIRMTTGSSGILFGFDINPFAVYLTQSNLLFQLIDFVQQTGKGIESFQVHRTDSLEPQSAHLYRSDADAIKSHKFEFVVGNPPYVRTRRLTSSDRETLADTLKQKFPDILAGKDALGTANLDLYIVFTAFGIDWLSQSHSQPGRLGFIETGKFLTGVNGAWLRELILERCAIEEIVDLMRVKNIFKTQDVYPIVLILRAETDREKRRSNSIRVKVVLKNNMDLLEGIQSIVPSEKPTYEDAQDFLTYTIPQHQFEDHKDKAFEIYLSRPLKEILAKIAPENHLTLADVISIDRGAERGGDNIWESRLLKHGLKPYGNNFVAKGEEVASLPLAERAYLKHFVDGDTIAPFVPEKSDEYLCYDPDAMSNPKNPELFERSQKIILPRRARFLFACLDTDHNYTLDDTYVGTLRGTAAQSFSYKYLLGLLNSQTLDFYHKMHYITRLQEDWFDYYEYTLSSLPVRKADPKLEAQIEALVGDLIESTIAYHSGTRQLLHARELVSGSRAAKTKSVGLSRLVRNKGGVNRRLETLRLKRDRIEFNRRESAPSYVEMVNETAAALLFDLLKEKSKLIQGQVVTEVLDSTEFPANTDSLEEIDLYRKTEMKRLDNVRSRSKKMHEELDWIVAQAYGLTKSEHQTMIRALNLLTLTQPLAGKPLPDESLSTQLQVDSKLG